MTVWFVSRHPGALEWARRRRLQYDRHVEHIDPQQVQTGDTVVGSLPVSHAARVCERGATFVSLALDPPRRMRGRELSADELERYGARLEAFAIRRTK